MPGPDQDRSGPSIRSRSVCRRPCSAGVSWLAIAGVGFGGGFQGGIRLVVPLAGERERAGVLSLLYIVSYLGLGAPAVIAGVLVTEMNGVLDTAREYGSAVILLAALALAGLLLHRRPVTAVDESRVSAGG
jgi:hypothetical protein